MRVQWVEDEAGAELGLGLWERRGGNRAERVKDRETDRRNPTRFTDNRAVLAHSRHLIMVD